jgi:hypothetical protein
MPLAGWITLGIGGAILVVGIVARRLELRARPHCPVHNTPMELWGDVEYEEYVCRTKGCTWCADIYDDGRVHFFST